MAAKAVCTTGRRKTSSARVFISALPAKDAVGKKIEAAEIDGAEVAQDEPSEASITVNKRDFTDYFPRKTTQMIIRQPLELTDRVEAYQFKVTVRGGGLSGQAGAVLLGIARALERVEPELRKPLKKAGFLSRDQRAVERKKPGRHKARKRPQFSKR